jgi:hypothetical protein
VSFERIYNLFFSFFRPARLRLLYGLFEIHPDTKVLDIGGSAYFWELARRYQRPVPNVTVVNIFPSDEATPTELTWVIGDGRQLPFKDMSFDLVFCNSVIEHLGTRESQIKFASEIRRVASQHFVQTPNARFFLEPHYIAPFIHWLPRNTQKYLVRYATPRGLLSFPDFRTCDRLVAELRLLDSRDLKQLFPDSRVLAERFCRMSKSLVAVRASG